MDTPTGYVYLRTNHWLKKLELIKIGITGDIINRANSYITGEPICGSYILIIAIYIDKLHFIDRLLKDELKEYHYQNDGGTEFYKDIVDISIISDILNTYNITFHALSNDELAIINHRQYEQITYNEPTMEYEEWRLQRLSENMIIQNTYTPNSIQSITLENIFMYYLTNAIGYIIWTCGLGKTLLSIFSVGKLLCKSVIIGVPSIYLQAQFKDEVLRIYPHPENIILIGGSGKHPSMDNIIYKIRNATLDKPVFIITTYSSCKYLIHKDLIVDYKIGDEAHHLVGKLENGEYRLFHNIQSAKSLYMTATQKIVDGDNVASMNDETYFGKMIDSKTTSWAIENGYITDYRIVVLKMETVMLNYLLRQSDIPSSNSSLFLSSYMVVYSIFKNPRITHILIFANQISNADCIYEYMRLLMTQHLMFYLKMSCADFDALEHSENSIEENDVFNSSTITSEWKEIIGKYRGFIVEQMTDEDYYLLVDKILLENVYIKSLSSKSNLNINEEIGIFTRSKWGIIPSVYMFDEGVNIPIVNAVCVAENMTSNIRITQSLLRGNRKNANVPDKKAIILLPVCYDILYYDTKDKDFKSIVHIIRQLSSTDEHIIERIKVHSVSLVSDSISSDSTSSENMGISIKLDTIEMNKIQLLLKQRLNIDFTEDEKEYQYYKELNYQNRVISSFQHRDNSCVHIGGTLNIEGEDFYINPLEYFSKRGVWKGWRDFLCLDKYDCFIQSKEDWIKRCKELEIDSIEKYKIMCQEYKELHPEPSIYYIDFQSIEKELNSQIETRIVRRRRR